MRKAITVAVIIYFILPAILYAESDYSRRSKVIDDTLILMEQITEARAKPSAALKRKNLYAQKKQYVRKEAELYPAEEPRKEIKFAQDIRKDIRAKFGERAYAAFGVQAGYIRGDTTYHMSFDNPIEIGGHGESELEWPLSNSLIGINADFNYRQSKKDQDIRDRDRIAFSWFTNINKKSGEMKDSDWIENDVGLIDFSDDGLLNNSAIGAWNNPGKDIYSETNSKLDKGHIFDVNYTHNFWPLENWGIGPQVGYRYQKFSFSAYDLDQVGYGPYGPGFFDQSYKDTRGLKWITYEAKYNIPFFGLNSELTWKNKFFLLFNFGYSGWVSVRDKDTHLYPTEDEQTGINHDMVSKGKTKGEAYLSGIKGGWRFWPNWLLSAGGSYVDIKAKGSIVQNEYYDGVLWGVSPAIGEKVTSQYWLVDASVRYDF